MVHTTVYVTFPTIQPLYSLTLKMKCLSLLHLAVNHTVTTIPPLSLGYLWFTSMDWIHSDQMAHTREQVLFFDLPKCVLFMAHILWNAFKSFVFGAVWFSETGISIVSSLQHFTEADARLFAVSAEHPGLLWCRQINPPAPMYWVCFICQSNWWVVFDRSYTDWQKSVLGNWSHHEIETDHFYSFHEILKCILYLSILFSVNLAYIQDLR